MYTHMFHDDPKSRPASSVAAGRRGERGSPTHTYTYNNNMCIYYI